MSKRIAEVQERIAKALSGLPDVFSTVQWGGRAYKLPGAGGSRKKPKLLAHVWPDDDGDSIWVSFKLDKSRAEAVVDGHDWIKPHSFRTLAPSGWVSAEVRTKAQCGTIAKLLKESRSLHPNTHEKPARRGKPAPDVDPVVRRMELVVREKKAAGWSPDHS